MARVVANNDENTHLPTTKLFMDRLSHSIIKETSKSLKHYLDVKRREDGFILNLNPCTSNSVPLKARYLYGTTKEYPPCCRSLYSDNDVKLYLRCLKQQQKSTPSISSSPEKKVCREELNFHMRENKYSSKESLKFAELRLRPTTRSSSSCSLGTNHDLQKRTSKSAFKLPRYEQDQLIDNTANILASMVKARRSTYEKYLLSHQKSTVYVSRNTNPSPRQAEDQTNEQFKLEPLNDPLTDLKRLPANEEDKKSKRKTDNVLSKAISIMHKAKLITIGILCNYKVSITTGTRNGASTNAPIRIKFYGTNGCTDFIQVEESETHHVPFLKAQTDVFTIKAYHVGQLAGISIGHEKKDARSSWFLNKVSVDDPIRNITYDIQCNSWLSIQSSDHKTMRDFPVTSVIPHENNMDFDEYLQDFENRSNSSTTTNDNTPNTTDNITSNHDDQLTTHKRVKKHQKQLTKSIDSKISAKSQTSLAAIHSYLSQKPIPTTIESHFNRNEFASSPVSRNRSPILNPTPPIETEDENNIINRSHSTTPIKLNENTQLYRQSTFDRSPSQSPKEAKHDLNDTDSIDNDRLSPKPLSSERNKSKKGTDEDDILSFFEQE